MTTRQFGNVLFPLLLLIGVTTAVTPITFETSPAAGCGVHNKNVAILDGVCHDVSNFAGLGYGGPLDVGVRSVNILPNSDQQQRLIAYADHKCNDQLAIVVGTGCAQLNGGAYSFALADRNLAKRDDLDARAQVGFRTGQPYTFFGVLYVVSSVLFEFDGNIGVVDFDDEGYENLVKNQWSARRNGDSTLMSGGQETGFVIIQNGDFSNAPASGMATIAGDAAFAANAMRASAVSYGVTRAGQLVGNFDITGEV